MKTEFCDCVRVGRREAQMESVIHSLENNTQFTEESEADDELLYTFANIASAAYAVVGGHSFQLKSREKQCTTEHWAEFQC